MMIWLSPQICQTYSVYLILSNTIAIFPYSSLKVTACAMGTGAYLFALCNNTALRLRFEKSMNNLHSSDLYTFSFNSFMRPITSIKYTKSSSSVKYFLNGSSLFPYGEIFVPFNRIFLSFSLEAKSAAPSFGRSSSLIKSLSSP